MTGGVDKAEASLAVESAPQEGHSDIPSTARQ